MKSLGFRVKVEGTESPAASLPFPFGSSSPSSTLAPYLWPPVFLGLTGGTESLRPASPLLLPARGWRLSLLAITLIVIMTPVATILRKINLHSNALISSRACAPPCPTQTRRASSSACCPRARELRPPRTGEVLLGGQGQDTVVV